MLTSLLSTSVLDALWALMPKQVMSTSLRSMSAVDAFWLDKPLQMSTLQLECLLVTMLSAPIA